MNKLLSVMKNSVLNRHEFIKLVLFCYLAFFVSGFYFSGLSSSRHGSWIKIGLLAFLVTFSCVLINGWRNKRLSCVCSFKNKNIECVIVFFLGAFFLYFIGQSIVFGNWSSVRRILVILLFVVLVTVFFVGLHFKISRVIFFIGLLCSFFSLAFAVDNLLQWRLLISHPVRLSDAGLSWYANYTNTVVAGQFWAFLFFAGLWSYLYSRSWWVSFFYLLVSVVMLFAIYHTAARTAWVAVGVGMVSLLFFLNSLERKKLLLVLIPALLFFVGYLFFAPEAVLRKGLTYRDVIWIEHFKGMNGVLEWLFGKGLLAPVDFVVLPGGQLASHTHSIYLEVLYTGGIFGLILLFSLIASVFYYLVAKSKKRKELSFAGAVLTGLFVSMVFDFHGILDLPNLMWLWLWFPIAMVIGSMFSLRLESSK